MFSLWGLSLVSSPLLSLASPLGGTVQFSRSLTVSEDTRAQPAGLGFCHVHIPLSSPPPPGERWNGIHMFKRFRASVHISSRGRHEQTLRRSLEDKALNIIDRELVLGLKRSGTFSMLPPPHTDDCALARRVTQSRWHTQSVHSPTVHQKAF